MDKPIYAWGAVMVLPPEGNDDLEPPADLKQPMNDREVARLMEWAMGHMLAAFGAMGPVGPNLRAEDKEELFQEALMALGAAAVKAEPVIVRWRPWLLTVCRNKALSHIRKALKKNKLEVRGVDVSAVAEPADVGSLLEQRKLRLRKEIRRLDPMYRGPLEMKLSGCSYAEIADVLGISEVAARKRVSRATQQLSRFMTE